MHLLPKTLEHVVRAGVLLVLACHAEAHPEPPSERATPYLNRTSGTLRIDSRLVETVEEARRRSPTFRDQWNRLTRERSLVLVIQCVHPDRLGGVRGKSRIDVDEERRLIATIVVSPSSRVVEVLAHELEHVMERLDGVRVDDVYGKGDPSVHRNGDGHETRRARLVGQRAWKEFRARPETP